MKAEAESIQRTLEFPVNTKYIAGENHTERRGARPGTQWGLALLLGLGLGGGRTSGSLAHRTYTLVDGLLSVKCTHESIFQFFPCSIRRFPVFPKIIEDQQHSKFVTLPTHASLNL